MIYSLICLSFHLTFLLLCLCFDFTVFVSLIFIFLYLIFKHICFCFFPIYSSFISTRLCLIIILIYSVWCYTLVSMGTSVHLKIRSKYSFNHNGISRSQQKDIKQTSILHGWTWKKPAQWMMRAVDFVHHLHFEHIKKASRNHCSEPNL